MNEGINIGQEDSRWSLQWLSTTAIDTASQQTSEWSRRSAQSGFCRCWRL